ncbi:hypothetical protein BN1723_007443 [Verticillium longisporum]|uniref:Uncharacterized protein n=1 Tax=Verticillium longisporum TaxID=100787 RepID=A0A0G4NLK8_VERLO|nr:hypothetical protein BN1723_007443 [Verticillium longisporum]
MLKQSKRKLAGVKEGEVDSIVLFLFASVAEGFGFRTEQTQELRRRNLDQEMILRFLRIIRKPDQYNFESLDDSVAQVIHVIKSHPWNQFPLAQRQLLRSLEVDYTNDPDCLQPMAVTEASNVMSNWEERCQKAEENAHAAENRLLNLAKEEEEINLRLNRLKEQEEKLSERTRELE